MNPQDFNLFKHIGAEASREALSLMHPESFKKRDVIFSEGDQPEWFHFVQEGKVKITKLSVEGKEIILELIQPGEFFGGIAVVRGFPYPGNAIAMEDTAVMKIAKADMQGLMNKHPEIMAGIVKDMGDRMRSSLETTKNIALEKVSSRIAALLIKLASKSGTERKEGIEIDMKLTKQDIAELVGTTVETSIRTMSQFKKKGLLEEHQGKILIKNLEGLEDLCQ